MPAQHDPIYRYMSRLAPYFHITTRSSLLVWPCSCLTWNFALCAPSCVAAWQEEVMPTRPWRGWWFLTRWMTHNMTTKGRSTPDRSTRVRSTPPAPFSSSPLWIHGNHRQIHGYRTRGLVSQGWLATVVTWGLHRPCSTSAVNGAMSYFFLW
jgi:hypothetical protein